MELTLKSGECYGKKFGLVHHSRNIRAGLGTNSPEFPTHLAVPRLRPDSIGLRGSSSLYTFTYGSVPNFGCRPDEVTHDLANGCSQSASK